MSRVFIIGAGFSKAIAEAPLANELFCRIYLEAQKDNDEIDKTKNQWQMDRDKFLEVVSHVENEIKPWTNHFKRNRWEVETCADIPDLYPLNIEYLCTLIDLNIEHSFAPKGSGVDLSLCQVPYMGGLKIEDLRHARDLINFYIVKLLLPDKLSPNRELLDKALSIVNSGDVVITFNYDLLVEQGLWKKGLWSPSNGYGVGKIQKQEKIESGNLYESKVIVIKPHGSVNWAVPYGNWQQEIEIYTIHPFTSAPLFEGLRAQSNRPAYGYSRTSHIVLPTYMKSIKYYWESQLLRAACEAVSKADEIFILGYSFPEADAMASFIFAQIPKQSSIKIVDIGNPLNLCKRLVDVYGLNGKIIPEANDIKKWVEDDFRYTEYEREIAEIKELEKLYGRPIEEPN